MKNVLKSAYFCKIWRISLNKMGFLHSAPFTTVAEIKPIFNFKHINRKGRECQQTWFYPTDFHFYIKVLAITLYLKICNHSFEILTKSLQERWSLLKIGYANHLWVPKKCEPKICNLNHWDSKSGCKKAPPPLPCMMFVSGEAELGALGVLLSTHWFPISKVYYYTVNN